MNTNPVTLPNLNDNYIGANILVSVIILGIILIVSLIIKKAKTRRKSEI